MNRRARSSQTIFMAVLGVLAPLAAISCSSTGAGPSEQTSLVGDTVEAKALNLAIDPNAPVLGAAHGSLLLPNGRTTPATPAFAADVQRYYLDRLVAEASPAVREEVAMWRWPNEGDPSELADNALLITRLIERVQPADAADLHSINRFIAKAVLYGELPRELGLVASNEQSRAEYQAACRDAQVPIPPTWNPNADDRENKWKRNGTEPLTPVFIGAESTTASVWYYTEPPTAVDDPNARGGTCVALPRTDLQTGMITSLGVICQSNDTNVACFWDSTRDFQPDAKVAIDSDGFNAGPDLNGGVGGKCTDCHRGRNAFITNPRSDLDLGADLLVASSARPVHPIVHAQWDQNSTFGEELANVTTRGVTESSCLICHLNGTGGQLPPLENARLFCDFVMMKAILPGPTRTMPLVYAGPSEVELQNPLVFRADEETIAAACNWPASALGFGPRIDMTEPVPSTDPLP